MSAMSDLDVRLQEAEELRVELGVVRGALAEAERDLERAEAHVEKFDELEERVEDYKLGLDAFLGRLMQVRTRALTQGEDDLMREVLTDFLEEFNLHDDIRNV